MHYFTTGKYHKEEVARLKQEAGDQDVQIEALLTPDQQTAYASYKQDQAARFSRWSASGRTAELQGNLNLTSEQADRAFAALYQVSSRTDQQRQVGRDGGEELYARRKDQQAKALESVLTPAQLEGYRQIRAAQTNSAGDLASKWKRQRLEIGCAMLRRWRAASQALRGL